MTIARLAAALCAAALCCAPARSATPPNVPAAAAAQHLMHSFGSLALSPDGTHLAAIESDEPKVDGDPVRSSLVIRSTDTGAAHVVALPCGTEPGCRPADPVWSPDGKILAYVVATPALSSRSLYVVDAGGMNPRKLLDFAGTLNSPRFAPSGRLAVLATAGARKEAGATQAGAPLVGQLGGPPDEQRIAIVDTANHSLHFASPPDLYVYEYDWKPDASGFAGTAAKGNGDDDWWVAHLYTFDAQSGAATDIYAPASSRMQLADPRISSDGKYVAFIGGLMSDFGSTGGDVYALPLSGGTAVDVTPQMAASATSLWWACPNDANRDHLSFTALEGDRYTIHESWPLGPKVPQHLGYSFGSTIASGLSFACTTGEKIDAAYVRQAFDAPPEIFVGTHAATYRQLTHVNDGIAPPAVAQSVTWRSNDFNVQGWLLEPYGLDPASKHPLIEVIHGGPSAANTPRFISRGALRDLLNEGYYIFFPNPRGSFGQGEAFTQANVKDFGYGDFRDDLAGIDAAEKLQPIDDKRLGITGGSYGGFMTMWAVTQTKRFRAAVAGAGVSDWISYYGENGIDQWMLPFFGASAYDDPAVYRKSSPIEFIKNVSTPTFAYVGQLDVECPAPQSLEFWHALQTLGVTSSLVIYPGEGHRLRDPAHIADVAKRTVEWFNTYLK